MTPNPGNVQLRELFAKEGPLLLPGAPNALAARMVEDIGFRAVYVTGAGITNASLGVPDLGLITLTELATHVAYIREAVELPLVVDADTGFGNAINVVRTVRTLERSGANAIQLEDQDFPKRCGHFDKKSVIPVDEMVQKLHAALDARSDPNLLVVARTDVRAIDGVDEAVDRAGAYVQAGADVIFVEGPKTLEEIAYVTKRVPAPQIINLVYGGATPIVSREQLAELGVAAVLYANAALQAAICGMEAVLTHLYRTGSVIGIEASLSSFEKRQRFVQKGLYDELEERYRVHG